MDQSQKYPVNVTNIKPADNNITTKKTEVSSENKSPSSSLYSTPRKKKMGGMLRWARSTITKKDLKIKRLQAQSRRLKRRLENMEQLLKTLEEKFNISNENLTCLKYTNVEVCNSCVESIQLHTLYSSIRLMLSFYYFQVQELIKRQAKSEESGFVSKNKYSPQLRCFALTLHYYSPKAYDYVRKTFNTSLPHPRTLRKW